MGLEIEDDNYDEDDGQDEILNDNDNVNDDEIIGATPQAEENEDDEGGSGNNEGSASERDDEEGNKTDNSEELEEPADYVVREEIKGNLENSTEFGSLQPQTDDTKVVVESFSEEQSDRYEAFIRSSFQKSTIKRLVQTLAGCPVNAQMAIAMSGITKIFVGELMEVARHVMAERGHSGPVCPSHIREAYRRLRQSGKVPLRFKPRLFHF